MKSETSMKKDKYINFLGVWETMFFFLVADCQSASTTPSNIWNLLPHYTFQTLVSFAIDPLSWICFCTDSVLLLVSSPDSPSFIFGFLGPFCSSTASPAGSAAGVWLRLAGCQLWQRAFENGRSFFVSYHGIWDLQENRKEIMLFHPPSSV